MDHSSIIAEAEQRKNLLDDMKRVRQQFMLKNPA